jgi:hypothetical protein
VCGCCCGARPVRALARGARWLLIGLIAIPVGYFLGHQFAFVVLGEPLRMVGHQQSA